MYNSIIADMHSRQEEGHAYDYDMTVQCRRGRGKALHVRLIRLMYESRKSLSLLLSIVDSQACD